MIKNRNDFDPKGYHPKFEWRFLSPKHWGEWLVIFAALPISLLPNRVRCWLAERISSYMIKNANKASRRAMVNLELCFPNKSEEERFSIIRKGFTSAGAFLLGFASLTIRSKSWLEKNSVITGLENLTTHTDNGENIILLVPHPWTIDILRFFVRQKGCPLLALSKNRRVKSMIG